MGTHNDNNVNFDILWIYDKAITPSPLPSESQTLRRRAVFAG
jgi:hypothetical protein